LAIVKKNPEIEKWNNMRNPPQNLDSLKLENY
jgi:hypothetical protein